jgi:hypothetical protein
MDILVEAILLLIFLYPGAFMRWIIGKCFRSKRTFKEYLADSFYWNGSVGMLVTALLVIFFVHLLREK